MIPVAASSSTGALSPRAYTANLSGTPFSASHASCAAPIRPPELLGVTVTVYAGWPATSLGTAPEIPRCCISFWSWVWICATVGSLSCLALAALSGVPLFAGSVPS